MLEIEKISVRFNSFGLQDVSLKVEQGDYLALLGVSGAGKTVILEVLAGLLKPQSGRILLHGNDITSLKIQQRRIGLVYQDLSLFPHLNVEKNIAYPLRNKKFSKKEVQSRIKELAKQTGIPHLLKRYPGTLSGGEAQRVALARTLASDPEILLLDEPLANLDVKLKSGLRGLLQHINRSGKTIIHVTHEYMEVATLANKVAVIENGRLVQTGTPESVFRHPESEFVAHFSGVKNIFPCRIEGNGNNNGLKKATLGKACEILFVGNEEVGSGFVIVSQEDIILSEGPLDTSAVNQLHGFIREVYLSGSAMEVVVSAGVDFVVAVSRKSFEKMNLKPEKPIWLNFKASSVKFIKN